MYVPTYLYLIDNFYYNYISVIFQTKYVIKLGNTFLNLYQIY